NRRVPILVLKFVVTGHDIVRPLRRLSPRFNFATLGRSLRALAGRQEFDQRRPIVFGQLREAGHSTSSALDRGLDLLRRQSRTNAQQAGKLWRGTLTIQTMTCGALLLIYDDAAAGLVRDDILRHLREPGHVVRIDVEHAPRRIDRGTTPLGASVKARKHD